MSIRIGRLKNVSLVLFDSECPQAGNIFIAKRDFCMVLLLVVNVLGHVREIVMRIRKSAIALLPREVLSEPVALADGV